MHPIVVLRQAINEILALPVQFVLQLHDISRLLPNRNFPFVCTGDDKFRFPDPLDFNHPFLSRLTFFVSFESITAFLEAPRARTKPFEERERDEISIRLKYCSNDRWQVLSNITGGGLDVGGYPSYLLVPDGPQGEEAQMGFNDLANCHFWAKPRAPVCFAAVKGLMYKPEGLVSHMIVDLRQPKGFEEFHRGCTAVLHPRFTDDTSCRLLDRLRQLDSQAEYEFLNLMTDLQAYPMRMCKSSKLQAVTSSLLESAPFTTCQTRAFKNFVNRRLALVWGPSATGNTHVLAHSIEIITFAHLKIGKGLRIGITAYRARH